MDVNVVNKARFQIGGTVENVILASLVVEGVNFYLGRLMLKMDRITKREELRVTCETGHPTNSSRQR